MPDSDGKSDRSGAINHQSRVATVAARQHGLATRMQLRECGLSDRQIARLIRDGWLHPLHHNVHAVGHRRLSERARLLAPLLSLGDAAFLSHRTAAAVWGLRAVNLHEIEVTLPGTGGRSRVGVTLHRTKSDPHPADVRDHVELRVSSVPRLLIELAPRETSAELERLVTLAVQKRLLRPDTRDGLATLEAALARHARRPGIAKLAAALAAYRRTEDHKSQLELAFDRFLAEHPEIPEPRRNIRLGIWEIDRYWPERHLAVELDGRPYHISVKDMERDRIKDAALHKLGVTPLRVTDFRFEHERPAVLEDLRHFLKLA
jgi:very-short-patch-repair endonuclease